MLHGLELPEDWKRRTRVFVAKAKVRLGVMPLVSRETYEAERRHSHRDDERALRSSAAANRRANPRD